MFFCTLSLKTKTLKENICQAAYDNTSKSTCQLSMSFCNIVNLTLTLQSMTRECITTLNRDLIEILVIRQRQNAQLQIKRFTARTEIDCTLQYRTCLQNEKLLNSQLCRQVTLCANKESKQFNICQTAEMQAISYCTMPH